MFHQKEEGRQAKLPKKATKSTPAAKKAARPTRDRDRKAPPIAVVLLFCRSRRSVICRSVVLSF
jgi:hypothetical protein